MIRSIVVLLALLSASCASAPSGPRGPVALGQTFFVGKTRLTGLDLAGA